MAETQLASMFIGSADDGDSIERGRPSDAGNMIHIVNPQTSEILDYITLDNIIEDTHKKSLESYLETYDAIVLGGDGFSYDQYLEKRNHIIIPDEDGTYQEFILFEVDKYRDTEGRKTHFYAHATYLELKKAKIIYPTRREGFTLSQHAGWALNNTGWRVGIVESEGVRTFNIENHTNPYEFIKRIANEFEVELRFRVEHDGRRITARYVDFLERIGDWKGREVEFGRDLDSIRRIEKQDVVTALLGLGPEREDGTRLEVLVEDEEALRRWGRVDEHGNLHHLIEPYEIQSDRQEMTEEEARQYTRTALDKRINTQVTYETTILDLEEVPGLEHEKIRFGDTIRIKDTYFNPPLYLEARVYEIERSIKSKAKKDIKLGDYIEYTEEEVNAIWNQLRNEIIRRMNRLAIVSITSTAGNVFKNAQGTTELTARTFVSGAERDEDGTLYDYQWMRFDKHGNHDADFYAEGKTITVKASDIDEKATYRVLVAYELEVINTAEITISNVFDGEDGEPGPPGPKGEDGQGVENITIEYYLSDSDSTPIGGTWTETKPPYQPNKYLWVRQKITYKNPTIIEYTTPVLDDSWKAVEIADEAKQEAEEAKQEAQQAQTTADGKNTIIFSETEPSTEGRKIGDTWFDTSRDNLMHRFNGVEWVEAKWGEQSIVANSITANHIKSLAGLNVNDQFIVDSQGNVKFAGTLEGASGTFGEVTVVDGDFNLQDVTTSVKYSATPKRNLIKDHSFELIRPDPDSVGPDAINHNWLEILPNTNYEDTPWKRYGSPKVAWQHAPDSKDALPIFGRKAIVVRNANFVRQYVDEGIGANSVYTVSAFFKRQWNVEPGGIPRIEIWHVDVLGNRVSRIVNATFTPVKNDYTYERHAVTFTTPANFSEGDSLEVIISGGNDKWVQCDGVQMVEGDRPSVYQPEDSIWEITSGMYRPIKRHTHWQVLWQGALYPLDIHTIVPEKTIYECVTGWVLEWSRYVPGSGEIDVQFSYSHIPKIAILHHAGTSFAFRIPRDFNQSWSKYLYIYHDKIKGHEYNNNQYANGVVLRAVYEY